MNDDSNLAETTSRGYTFQSFISDSKCVPVSERPGVQLLQLPLVTFCSLGFVPCKERLEWHVQETMEELVHDH